VAYLLFGKVTVTDGKAIEVTFWSREENGVFKLVQHLDILSVNYDYFYRAPLRIGSKTDIEIRANVSNGSAEISTSYDIVLVDI